MFLTTLINVLVMLAYGLIGFLLLFFKKCKKETIGSIATILMYVCAPAMVIDAFQQNIEPTKELVIDMLIFFGIITFVQILIILVFFLIFRKKFDDVRYRICTIASAMSNCSFFGIPLIQALLPNYPKAVILSCVYFLSMNLLGWTLVSAIIAKDKKYISIKKTFLNPAIISAVVAILLFAFKIKLPNTIGTMIMLLGKMTTPLCMIMLGMRLATVSFKSLFTDWRVYLAIFVKQIVMPFIVFLIVWWLPLDYEFKASIFIFAACPVAAVVLSYSEIVGEGQESACTAVILGTILAVVTLPLLVLIL